MTNEAASHFFEIQTAWAFYLTGFHIAWNAEPNASGGEFTATHDGILLNVECKAVLADVARAIKRSDFYRLVDQLLPALAAQGLKGQVDVELDGSLPRNHADLTAVAKELQNFFAVGQAPPHAHREE